MNARLMEEIKSLEEARDGFGLKVRLLNNPTDVWQVRAAIGRLGACFAPAAKFFRTSGEVAAARNLRLLAALLDDVTRDNAT